MILHIPSWNSSIIMARVDKVTLYVEFCCGYAGVIIGIKWNRSAILTYTKVHKDLNVPTI